MLLYFCCNRIEDVLTSYINIPDQERDKYVLNKQFILHELYMFKTSKHIRLFNFIIYYLYK